MACASLIDSISDVDHSLGLLGLPLAFNGGNLNGKQEAQARRKLNRRLPLLERELADRPIRHGNRNYVGMLYYILQEKDKAIGCWQRTVEEDPTNLNAIKDLCTAYAKLEDLEESREWQSRLEETQSKLSGNPDDEKRVYARCRAEQAYAACWDLHTQTWSKGVAPMKKTVKRFESALEYADKLISQDEKEDWHLAIGQAYERLSHRHKRNNNIPQYIHSINKAAQYLDFSISSSQHTLHKAEAWGVLGSALTYDSNDTPASIPNFINTKYREYWFAPSRCFDEALSLDPGNAWLLGSYGHLLRKLGHYEAAMEKLDESIKSDPSPSSWFSYDNRSKVYTQLARSTADKQVRERFLLLAEEDSKMADKSNPNPRSKSQRGEIAHDMAESSGTNQEKKHYSVQALAHFAESLQIQDGMDISDAHLKRGKCLLERNRWSALQSFKKAYDTSFSIDFQERIASKYLLPNQLDHYKDEKKPENLLAKLAYWITDANVRHLSMTLIFEILGKLARKRFQNEILDVMEYIVVKQPTVFGVDRMTVVDEGFITLRKTSFRRENFKRLCNLENQHTTRMHSTSSLGPTTPLPDHQPPEKAKNPKWQNDFYVITPKKSTPWVQYSLLPVMECLLYSLKGFYQQRDQALGELRLKSQAEAIKKSASIIIVHSESFSDDLECQHLFGIACGTKPPQQMALLKLDSTPIAPHMTQIATQFDFGGSQTQVPPQWCELAKFLS